MKSQLLAGCALACLLMSLAATPAVAQDKAPAAEQIEEVIVTAQKRSESAQAVPVAITAFTGEALEKQGITSVDNLATVTPGLTFGRVGPGAGTPFLRGVGSNITSPGSEAAVSTYVDNVYIGSQYASIFSFNNIAAIEVDKGPQGTLFGRNATGGVIQITTKDPGHVRSGDAKVGYGNYNTIDATAYGTTGVTENIAADLALYYHNQKKGWGKNLYTGDDVFTSKNFAARSKWVWAPSDATKVTLIADYAKDRQDVGTARNTVEGGAFRPPGATGNPGPFLSTYIGFYNVDLNRPAYSDSRQYGASLKVWHDLGAAELVSITAYRKAEVHGPIDSDGTPADWKALDTNPWSETFTQEVQLLSSTASDSKLKWILGGFFYHDKATDNPITFLGYGYSALAPVDIYVYQTTTSFAAFTQGAYSFTDDTRVTVGLRDTVDYRETQGSQTLRLATPVVLAKTTQPGSTIASARTAKFSKPTFKVSLDHDFAEGVLGYLTYSRGFKAGVFNMVSLNTDPVKPETIDAVEGGLKSDWLDHRLRINLAAYHYDYKNLQVQQFVNGFYTLSNAAAAKIKGVDFEVTGKPLRGLTLQLSGTLMDPTYTSFVGGPGYTAVPITSVNPSGGMGGFTLAPIELSGKQLTYASKRTVNFSTQYTWPLRTGDLSLFAVAQYRSTYYFDPQNGAKQPSYTMINGSLTWTAPSGNLDVKLWGNNLTNEKIYATIARSTAGDSATPQAPRMYGVSLGMHF
ncbi:iron complex outermembrane recepter protein [Caulobacter sp. UNC279MFTsu5.1]|nr:iron complex outermembrane recepter protein [Caulobacter sp. UNC279MFTsu5.1]